jgi:hypothetical protein
MLLRKAFKATKAREYRYVDDNLSCRGDGGGGGGGGEIC